MQRFEATVAPQEDVWEPPKGDGTALSLMPQVVENLGKLTRSDELLHTAHRILFNKRSKKQDVKPNLLAFSGLEYAVGKEPVADAESMTKMGAEFRAEREKIEAKCGKLQLAFIKRLLDFFDIDR